MGEQLEADTRRVAVIDDDLRFIRLVERALQDESMEVLPVTTLDIEEAVTVVAAAGCDAALVDIYMYGDALGFRLIERLREEPQTATMPIIVTSGARREIGRRVAFLQEHECGLLLKPFDVDELVAKLRGASPAPAATRLPPPVPLSVVPTVVEATQGGPA